MNIKKLWHAIASAIMRAALKASQKEHEVAMDLFNKTIAKLEATIKKDKELVASAESQIMQLQQTKNSIRTITDKKEVQLAKIKEICA